MPEPQAVLAPLTRAAFVLVVTVDAGEDNAARVRSFAADLPGLVRSVGFRDLDAGLSCVAGFGSDVWPRLFSTPPPAQLHPFRELAGDRHRAPATPGDLVLHIRAGRPDLCFELATQALTALGGAVTPSTRCRASGSSTSATCSASSTARRTRPAGPPPRRR